MKNGMSRKLMLPGKNKVNVYDLATKEIVFTGETMEVAGFLGVGPGVVSYYSSRKYKFRKKYALRYAKNETV